MMKCPYCQFENVEGGRYCSRCSRPLPPASGGPEEITQTYSAAAPELARGTTFAGRYEIIEELGRGGMGTIYRVFDKEIGEDVAVKILNPEIAADRKTIERFRNELKLARRIVHKNVGRMFDLNEAGGRYFISMEYVPGENLASMIKMTRQLSIRAAVNIARQVSEGLAEAHRLGIIHRDLKPGNIMIDRDGTARIMDFGISRSLEADGVTQAGFVIGTVEYMAREQIEGREADPRSDIYSLGIILYEMVTGQLPFKGDSILSVALKHRTEQPRDPRLFNPQCPEELSRLILGCLEKEKGRRPQSAEELTAALNVIEAAFPATDRLPQKKGTDAEKTVVIRWRSLVIALVAAAVLLGILIVAGRKILFNGGSPITSIAVLPFENINADFDTEYLSDGITENIIGKLTQLPSLKKVIARSSSFRYKGRPIDPQAAGRELGVDAVLVGRLAKREDELSITVELIKVRDNSRMWGNQYRLSIPEIFAVEGQITGSITENLRLQLSGEQRARLAKKYTENSQAFIAYSKGSYFWNKRTEEDLMRAIGYFEEAIRLDPNYALAYTGLSYSYLLLPEYGSYPPKLGYPRAKDAALKSIAIDPALSEAHVCLAQLKWRFDRDREASKREYLMAIDLDPGNATAHHWYGYDLMCYADFENAIKEIRRGLELDPRSLVINRNMGQVLFRARRYEEAREALQKTLEMDPTFAFTHNYLGMIEFERSRYAAALTEFRLEKQNARGWDARIDSLIGVTLLKLGQRNRAEEIRDELLRQSEKVYTPPTALAVLYFALGDIDSGFSWLDRAYDEYDSHLRFLKIERLYDVVRPDPRFQELLRKMDLAD